MQPAIIQLMTHFGHNSRVFQHSQFSLSNLFCPVEHPLLLLLLLCHPKDQDCRVVFLKGVNNSDDTRPQRWERDAWSHYSWMGRQTKASGYKSRQGRGYRKASKQNKLLLWGSLVLFFSYTGFREASHMLIDSSVVQTLAQLAHSLITKCFIVISQIVGVPWLA